MSQSSPKEDQEALVLDIGMITGTEIIEGEVAAGAEIGMIETGIVVGIEITIVEAGATVGVQTTAKMMVKGGMMMRGGAEADHTEVPHLVEVAPVLGEAPHQEYLLRMKVLVDVLVRSDLQLQGVLHHVGDQLILVVNLLANLM